MASEAVKVRKAPARQTNVVLGCIEERLSILRAGPFPSRPVQTGELADAVLFCESNANRMADLLDELNRSLRMKQNGSEE